MMTKAVGTDTLQQHLRFMKFRSMAGRAVKASKLLNSVTSSAITSAVGGCKNTHPMRPTENPMNVSYEPYVLRTNEIAINRGSRNMNATVCFAVIVIVIVIIIVIVMVIVIERIFG